MGIDTWEERGFCQSFDETLMRTEQEQTIGEDDINEIFRTMHTIKGSAAMMGLQNMSTLAHAMEDLFYIIRDDPNVKYDKAGLYELLFASSDSLKGELKNYGDNVLLVYPLPILRSLRGRYTPLPHR